MRPPLKDKPIGNTDNRPSGGLADSPVGNTDNQGVGGLKDAPRGGTSNALKDLDPIVYASYVPLDGTEPGLVLGVNLNSERVDVTGNHTFTDNVIYTANASVDGQRSVAQIGTGSRIYTDAGTAHRIATAAAVSYGGMFKMDAGQLYDNATMLSSSTTTGSTNQNYGVRAKTSLDRFERVPGSNADFAGTAIPYDTWFHICVTENAGRTVSKLYINGALLYTGSPAATGAVLATNRFWVGELAGQAQTSVQGLVSDVFVSSLELTEAQVLTFATNAFGGTPPAAP